MGKIGSNQPSEEWTDSERIKLALFILNSPLVTSPGLGPEKEEAIRATTHLLELPSEQLEAMREQLMECAERVNPESE